MDVLNGLEKKSYFRDRKKSDSRELISSCNCAVRIFLLIYWKVVYKKDERSRKIVVQIKVVFLRVLRSVRVQLDP